MFGVEDDNAVNDKDIFRRGFCNVDRLCKTGERFDRS